MRKSTQICFFTFFFLYPSIIAPIILVIGAVASSSVNFGMGGLSISLESRPYEVVTLLLLILFACTVPTLLLYYLTIWHGRLEIKRPAIKRVAILLYYTSFSLWFLIAFAKLPYADPSFVYVVRPVAVYVCLSAMVASILILVDAMPRKTFLSQFYFDLDPIELQMAEPGIDKGIHPESINGAITFVDIASPSKEKHVIEFSVKGGHVRLLLPRAIFISRLVVMIHQDLSNWLNQQLLNKSKPQFSRFHERLDKVSFERSLLVLSIFSVCGVVAVLPVTLGLFSGSIGGDYNLGIMILQLTGFFFEFLSILIEHLVAFIIDVVERCEIIFK